VDSANSEGTAAAPAGCASGGNRKNLSVFTGECVPALVVPPAGTSLARVREIQVFNARADRYVIYRHEWFMNGMDLGPYGQRHVESIAATLSQVPYPGKIEPSGDPASDKSRLDLIVNELTRRGVADASKRVIIGYPTAEGLAGDEAERAYYSMISGGYGYGGYGGYGYNRPNNRPFSGYPTG